MPLYSNEQVSARPLAELREEAGTETHSRFVDPVTDQFVA